MPNTQGIEEKGIAINVNVCFLGVCLFLEFSIPPPRVLT